MTVKGEATWTVQRLLRWSVEFFQSRGIDQPRLDAEILLAAVLDATRVHPAHYALVRLLVAYGVGAAATNVNDAAAMARAYRRLAARPESVVNQAFREHAEALGA